MVSILRSLTSQTGSTSRCLTSSLVLLLLEDGTTPQDQLSLQHLLLQLRHQLQPLHRPLRQQEAVGTVSSPSFLATGSMTDARLLTETLRGAVLVWTALEFIFLGTGNTALTPPVQEWRPTQQRPGVFCRLGRYHLTPPWHLSLLLLRRYHCCSVLSVWEPVQLSGRRMVKRLLSDHRVCFGMGKKSSTQR